MNPIIETKRRELEQLCQRRRLKRIDLFGSAANSNFDPERSDLDFLVTFEELDGGEYADAYFGLLEDLQALFERPVDLVVDSAFRNSYFRQSVEATRTPIYAR